MQGQDPDDVALIIELRDEVARLVADALKTQTETRRETSRVHRANVVETARMQGSHDGEMGVMNDALDDALDAQNDHLTKGLATREGIGQAVGILVATMLCTPDDAFDLLVVQSQHENRKLVDVAAEIVAHAVRRAKPRR